MSKASPCLLSAEQLSCERGGRTLFQELSVQLNAGDIVWLQGSNGCGKSTLLRTLAGLRPAERGSIQHSAALRFLGHSNGLKPDLTVLEGLRFQARWQGLADDEASLLKALKHFGLAALRSRRSAQLSQGQQRRAALASLALPQAGACWLLDEPFDALDDDSVQQLCALLSSHAAAGGAVLFTSHQHLPGLASRQLPLSGGRP